MPWLDGEAYDGNVVPFDVADRGLLLGDGVFDTSMVLGGKMVWRAAHLERLTAACRTLGFAFDAAMLDGMIDAAVGTSKTASLRITVTRGSGPRGLAPPSDPKPVALVSVAPLRTVALFAPVKLHVTEIRRNETSPASRLKPLGYLDAILASRDAVAAGADDALFLNTKGSIACTTVGNILIIIGDQLITPPPADGVLDGIARKMILSRCDEIGLEPVERSISEADLDRVRAAIVTNSLRLVAPVTSIGRKHLGSSDSRRVQALIELVAKRVQAETGVDPRVIAEG